MTYRDILVLMDHEAPGVARAQLAADLAARWNSHLTGVFLTSDFVLQYGAAESLTGLSASAIDQILSDHSNAVAEAGKLAQSNFEAAAKGAGAAFSWLSVGGDHQGELEACARRTDLVIVPSRMTVPMGQRHLAASDIALSCGGPVLITPKEGYAPPLGKRVLIAWNGSREAARALRDAWPHIEAAEEVNVLVVTPDGEVGRESTLQRLLERHGAKARLIVERSQDECAAEVIERQMAELDIDLLVMGLYGHHRMREWVLGGVSRQLLADVPTPLFVSH